MYWIQLIVFIISIFGSIIPIIFIKYYVMILLIYIPGLFGIFGVSLILCGLTLKYKVLGVVKFILFYYFVCYKCILY